MRVPGTGTSDASDDFGNAPLRDAEPLVPVARDAAVECPDGSAPGSPDCACGSLAFTIATQQSCAIDIASGQEIDGEGFITVGGVDFRIFALDRWGKGHIVAWCDATTSPQLLDAFDAFRYLGQTDAPRVVSWGDALCSPDWLKDPSVTYMTPELAAQYRDDGAKLAADFDVVVACGFRIAWMHDWASELQEFVSVHGKGLLAVMDYHGPAAVQPRDYVNMSAITAPSGITFAQLNVDWAPASTTVDIACVPDLPTVD